MDFKELALHPDLARGIEEAGYITCTPVQEQVLASALDGTDLYVQSQTGTGKTAAYLIAILQRMTADPALAGKRALIMVPTRELAVQVEEEAHILGKYMPIKIASFYGGVGYGRQQELLKSGTDIIIGTPGRVIDLEQSGTMDLSAVAFLVIDEADRMFDMGFYPDLRTLIKALPKAEDRQTMLFSATLNTWVKNLAWEYTCDAKEITIESDLITVEEIEQMLFHVSSDEKTKLLLGIIEHEKPESIIVFCNTKRMSEVIAKRLSLNGLETEFIIGDLPQSKRLQVIDSFKRGSLKCLVATDVAARGIDVNDLAMVVNYDLPNEAENYVHRIGRTARAGKTGKAYSFCSEQDVYNLPAIEKYLEKIIPSSVASEEMMAEDKSSGVYIRTGIYGDEDEHRGVRSTAARTSGGNGRFRGAERGRPGDRNSAGRRSSERPDMRSASGRSPAPRNYEAAGRSGSERSDSQSGGDLSSLSFDERMAVYRKKYGGEAAPRNSTGSVKDGQRRNRGGQGAGRKASGTPGAKTAAPGNKPAAQKTSAQKVSSAQRQNTANGRTVQKPGNAGARERRPDNRRNTSSGARSASPSAQKVTPQQSAVPVQTKKPGLLDKLKSMFSGKK